MMSLDSVITTPLCTSTGASAFGLMAMNSGVRCWLLTRSTGRLIHCSRFSPRQRRTFCEQFDIEK